MGYYESKVTLQYKERLERALKQLEEEKKLLSEITTDRQLRKIEKRIIKLKSKVRKIRSKIHEGLHDEKQLTMEQLRVLDVLSDYIKAIVTFIMRIPLTIFWIFPPKEEKQEKEDRE